MDISNHHVQIKSQTNRHVVNRIAGPDFPTLMIGYAVGFAVNQGGLDIPQPVIPFISMALN